MKTLAEEINDILRHSPARDSINGKRGFGWDTNPFVWVIQFRKVKTIAGAKE